MSFYLPKILENKDFSPLFLAAPQNPMYLYVFSLCLGYRYPFLKPLDFIGFRNTAFCELFRETFQTHYNLLSLLLYYTFWKVLKTEYCLSKPLREEAVQLSSTRKWLILITLFCLNIISFLVKLVNIRKKKWAQKKQGAQLWPVSKNTQMPTHIQKQNILVSATMTNFKYKFWKSST